MTPRTVAPPATDTTMWRRLLKKVHPDAGGDHELFIWASALKESVCVGRSEDRREGAGRDQQRRSRSREGGSARVPFEAAFEKAEGFADLTQQAVRLAEGLDPAYGRLLRFLEDCSEAGEDEPGYRAQFTGATYKQLAYIAHLAGLDAAQRWSWYEIAEGVPLAGRHAGHIIARLQKERRDG